MLPLYIYTLSFNTARPGYNQSDKCRNVELIFTAEENVKFTHWCKSDYLFVSVSVRKQTAFVCFVSVAVFVLCIAMQNQPQNFVLQ